MQIPSIQIQKKINGFFYGLKELFITKSFIFSGNTAYISHKPVCCLYFLRFSPSFDTFAVLPNLPESLPMGAACIRQNKNVINIAEQKAELV